jgi:hypothetical protein
MASEPVLQPEIAAGKGAGRYRISWIDWLIGAITRLPGPSWLAYLVLLLVLIVLNNALRWWDGTVPAGTLDPARSSDALFPIYFLALMHYLNGCAGRALEKFRPVTDLSDEEYARLSHELQSVPAWPALIIGVVGVVVTLRKFVTDQASFGIYPNSSLLTILYVCVLAVFWGATVFVFLYHTVRQLNLVNRIYRRATRIDLFHLQPVYAFSALTARTGIGLIFFLYYMIVTSGGNSAPAPNDLTLTIAQGISISSDEPGLFIIGAMLLPGIVAFILPLLGIHRRLVEEKNRQSAEVAARLNLAVANLHQNVDADNFDRMAGINSALSALKLERDELSKISTWPWETGTLRGFVTAILIPILLWLVTRLLDRIF